MNLSGTDALAALDFLAEHSFVRPLPPCTDPLHNLLWRVKQTPALGGPALRRLLQGCDLHGAAPNAAWPPSCISVVGPTFGFGLLPPQELGNLSESEGHAMRLLDYGPAAKERARALLRKVTPGMTACRSMAASPPASYCVAGKNGLWRHTQAAFTGSFVSAGSRSAAVCSACQARRQHRCRRAHL